MFEPVDDITPDPERSRKLRDELMRQVDKDTGRKKRNPWITVVPAVLLAAGLTTAAIATLLPVTDKNVVHCFARAELHDDGSYPGTRVAVAAPNGGGTVPVEDAIAACAQAWKNGALDPTEADGVPGGNGTPPPPPRPGRDGDVPAEFTVCVMRDGTAGVVPGDEDICVQLGLANRLGT